MLSGPKKTIVRARKLRRSLSLPEGLLWRLLRTRPADLKFRRQHPAGPYILDFYCADARLAIEIDGQSHSMGERPEHDAARDSWLNSIGVEVLRIPAANVLNDIGAAADFIVSECRARLPLHHPSDGPPPRAGEEF